MRGDDALVLRHGAPVEGLLEVWTTIKVPYDRDTSIVRDYPRPKLRLRDETIRQRSYHPRTLIPELTCSGVGSLPLP